MKYTMTQVYTHSMAIYLSILDDFPPSDCKVFIDKIEAMWFHSRILNETHIKMLLKIEVNK